MMNINLFVNLCATGLLLSIFLMVGKIRLIPMLRYFTLSSLFLAGLSISVSILKGESHFLPAIITILFKVVFVPGIIYWTAKKIPSSKQLRMYWRPATTYVLFALILCLSGFIVRDIPINMEELHGSLILFRSLLFISVSLVLAGILMLIVRRDLFSQVLGILTMENGISAFALVALEGVPLFLEMGIFLVILLSTIILAFLTDKVHEIYRIGDTANLNELID